MPAPKSLRKRKNRLIITAIILVVCALITYYYATAPQDAILNVFGRQLSVEVSRYIIIAITIISGLIVGFFVNILSGDVHETLKEDNSDKDKKPEIITPNIEIKNIISPQPESNQPRIPEPANQKFYPSTFIPDLKFFVGRKKLLKDLEKKLKTKQRASIHDISGLGKTFTTLKYAEEHRNRYEKIFFVRASKEEMMQSLAEIGVLLNPSLKEVPEQTKQASGFKKWLEENENWLVIYDNVDKPHELNPYVPQNKKGDCIFTSNFHSIETLAESVGIEKLDDKDAESLLFSRANNKPHSKPQFSNAEEQKAFENIVRETDGHPLSLNTSGAFVSENRISFTEYERKLQRAPDILLKNEDGFDNYQRKSALRAFSIAIEDICEKKPGDNFENSAGLAEKLLFAASYIAPDNIYEDFLKRILQTIAEIDFDSEENEDLWLEIRRKLLAYDLLKYDTATKTFTTHRLIQKVIQTKQSDDDKKFYCQQVLEILFDLLPRYDYFNKEDYDRFYLHSQTVLENAYKLNIQSETIVFFYEQLANYQNLSGNYNQTEIFCLRQLEIVREVFGNEHTITGVSLNNLAVVYLSQSKYEEAIELFKQALEIAEKTIGKEHPDYATRLNNLAEVYQLQSRFEEAIELFKQALEIDKKTIGKEHPGYAIHLNNLASVYKSQERYEEAIELYKQALEVTGKTKGKEHPAYATRLNNLAGVYKSQGKYNEAIQLYKQAIEIVEKTIGKEHPDYAIHLNNLALVYKSQGRYEEALSLYEESLGIFENTLPENHPSIQTVRKNLELCRRAAGKG